MLTGRLRQDNSGHYYIIPEDLLFCHDELIEKIDKIKEGSHKYYQALVNCTCH